MINQFDFKAGTKGCILPICVGIFKLENACSNSGIGEVIWFINV
jgi:hypothetical protein